MDKKILAVLTGAALLLLCLSGLPAFADGMPFNVSKPQPILTPLDKTLDQTETKEQPIDINPPENTNSRVADILPNSSFFGLSVGVYDPFTHGKAATAFNAEWQPDVKLAGFLQPLLGAMVTTRGSLLGYGGLGVPVKLGEHVQLIPSLALGLYRKGGGYDLGQTLVLRAGTELSYMFKDTSRIGLNFHILSNGTSTNSADRTTILGIAYTMPLGVPSKTAEQPLAVYNK